MISRDKFSLNFILTTNKLSIWILILLVSAPMEFAAFGIIIIWKGMSIVMLCSEYVNGFSDDDDDVVCWIFLHLLSWVSLGHSNAIHALQGGRREKKNRLIWRFGRALVTSYYLAEVYGSHHLIYCKYLTALPVIIKEIWGLLFVWLVHKTDADLFAFGLQKTTDQTQPRGLSS